jgi:hypothetical protein
VRAVDGGPRSATVRRGLRAPREEVVLCHPAMDDLVTIASFADVAEAELTRERLELEGIRAFVLGAQTAGVMPFLASATGGVRVQVEPKDAQRAKEILGS